LGAQGTSYPSFIAGGCLQYGEHGAPSYPLPRLREEDCNLQGQAGGATAQECQRLRSASRGRTGRGGTRIDTII